MIIAVLDGRESTFDKIKETDHGANETCQRGEGGKTKKSKITDSYLKKVHSGSDRQARRAPVYNLSGS